ncbi:MAG: hypothetical protein ACT4P6_12205 [Gemmatimonadaceae bacterium]
MHKRTNAIQTVGGKVSVVREAQLSVLLGGIAGAAFGVLAGGLVALGISNRIEPVLFDTSAREPLAYAVAGGSILLLTLIASPLPGIRATKVDPPVALRASDSVWG